jgi:uncharacterized protein
MRKMVLAVALTVLVCACSRKDNVLSTLPDMSAVRANLAFTCVHEADHLPPLDPKADSLFQYARYLQKKDGPKNFDEIAGLYRIAAAHGHYKANQNAQLLVSQGMATSPDALKEVVDLAADLVKQGVPGGYYDIGHYLEQGYGLKPDSEMALRYFRKAADLGSPEAQEYIADLLMPPDKSPAIARQMRQCSTDQGYGPAAMQLGADLMTDRQFPGAVKAYQAGVQAGNPESALALESGFKGPPPTDEINYLGLPADSERAQRYRAIWKFINANDGRNPKVPDVDRIVPLPPATLPPWDGTFEWQKTQDATPVPAKPSDELIEALAKEKGLDPHTGLRLAGGNNRQSESE